MKDKWEELLAVLNNMLSIYQAILTLSQQKNKILVAAKSKDLEKVTKQEEILLIQVGKLEEIRGKLINELMTAHGITGDRVSMSELCKIAKPDIMEQLETFRKEFEGVVAKIVPLNAQNTELITQALGFINYNMNLLSQIAVGPTYAAKGQSNEQGAKRRLFDARV